MINKIYFKTLLLNNNIMGGSACIQSYIYKFSINRYSYLELNTFFQKKKHLFLYFHSDWLWPLDMWEENYLLSPFNFFITFAIWDLIAKFLHGKSHHRNFQFSSRLFSFMLNNIIIENWSLSLKKKWKKLLFKIFTFKKVYK